MMHMPVSAINHKKGEKSKLKVITAARVHGALDDGDEQEIMA